MILNLKSLMWLVMLMVSSLAVAAPRPDPTRPDVAPAQADAPKADIGLQLNAIVLGQNRRTAVINGTALQVGDRIDTARVLAIEDGRVVLERKGQRLVLQGAQPAKVRSGVNITKVGGR